MKRTSENSVCSNKVQITLSLHYLLPSLLMKEHYTQSLHYIIFPKISYILDHKKTSQQILKEQKLYSMFSDIKRVWNQWRYLNIWRFLKHVFKKKLEMQLWEKPKIVCSEPTTTWIVLQMSVNFPTYLCFFNGFM